MAQAVERIPRPDIVDRNGIVLATDVSVASLFADPRKILDIEEAVELIATSLPDVDAQRLHKKTDPARPRFCMDQASGEPGRAGRGL